MTQTLDNLLPQTPAKGIVKINAWGKSKMYAAVCICGSNTCSHTIDIEVDDSNTIIVTIYTKQFTERKNRWSQIWQLLTKGYVELESSIVLDSQSALNYSAVLAQSVKDSKEIRDLKNV
jgi:hypothetical protein